MLFYKRIHPTKSSKYLFHSENISYVLKALNITKASFFQKKGK